MRKPTSGENVHKFTAALVWETTHIDGWGEEYPSGTLTSYGYALNFCPVCGKEYTKNARKTTMTVLEHLKQQKNCTHLNVELHDFITDELLAGGSYSFTINVLEKESDYACIANAICMNDYTSATAKYGTMLIYYIRQLDQYSAEDLAEAANALARVNIENKARMERNEIECVR